MKNWPIEYVIFTLLSLKLHFTFKSTFTIIFFSSRSNLIILMQWLQIGLMIQLDIQLQTIQITGIKAITRLGPMQVQIFGLVTAILTHMLIKMVCLLSFYRYDVFILLNPNFDFFLFFHFCFSRCKCHELLLWQTGNGLRRSVWSFGSNR